MPFVHKLFIYPVKSLDGVSVDAAEVWPGGALAHDREFAVFNANHQAVCAKTHPAMQRIRAQFNLPERHLTLRVNGDADMFHLDDDRADLEKWFSEYLGEWVTFRQNDEMGFPDDTDRTGPTVVSIESLTEVGEWFGLDLDEARRRFRTNVEVHQTGQPFWEDQLFAEPGLSVEFNLGEVEVLGQQPCPRCPVPARDSQTAENDSGFQKRFVERRRETLPDFVDADVFGHFYRLAINTRIRYDQRGKAVRVGDPVTIA